MNEDLIKLIRIQELDSEILAKKRESDLIPKRVEETSIMLDGAKRKLEDFETTLKSLDRKRREHEQEVEDQGSRIRKLEDRVASLKTNEEYQAHLKEVEKVKQVIGGIEERILLIMEEREGLGPRREKLEEEMTEATARWQEAKRVLENEGKKLEHEMRRLRESRAGLAAGIQGDVYRKYMELMQQNNGRAVVAAVDEICLGCHLNMPPQHFNNLKTNESITFCPACGRIIYYKEED